MFEKPNFLILCAGKAKRMRPLSDFIPKPLLPFKGKPMIYWTISAIRNMDLSRIGIIVSINSLQIFERYIKLEFPNLDIKFFVQKEQTGIVSAILSASEFKDQSLIAVAGDTVFNETEIFSFYQHLITGDSSIILGVKERRKEEMLRRSNIVVNNKEDMIVERTIEKPTIDEIEGNFSGVPIWGFKSKTWKHLHSTEISERGEFVIAGTVSSALKHNLLVKAIEFNDIHDLTFPQDILRYNFPYISNLINGET